MIGTSLTHYRIVEKLGQGGMGEVYRAEDTSLSRHVAIKVLPDEFASDPERLARFEREAKVLASLNHPNIAAIHGLEQTDGKRFLVLELVEGQTLAHRLQKGPLPVDEALEVCRHIAEGLEAAHEKGVIHRDLKPGNVMITPDDKVKILDFGLARMFQDSLSEAAQTHSPTITEAMTRAGTILGTAAYMSPEQARGKPVDRRADVWAFGCILYECLTGKQPFEGETITETISSILKVPPNWTALPAGVPQKVRDLLSRCLQKSLGERLHDIGDARIEITEALQRPEGEAIVTGPLVRTRALLAGLGLLVLLGGAILGIVIDRVFLHRPMAPVVRAALPLPAGLQLTRDRQGAVRTEVAICPDGSYLVFSGSPDGSTDKAMLYKRPIDRGDVVPIPGTEGARAPFFSPDGRWTGFWAKGKLCRVAAAGGIPNPICAIPIVPFGASWGSDDSIIFGADTSGLLRVSAAGGTPESVLAVNPNTESSVRLPFILPDGRAMLFTAMPHSWGVDARIEVFSFPSGQRRILMEDAADARYVATGHLLFMRRGLLMAVPFDPTQLAVAGPSATVVSGIMHALNETSSQLNSASGQLAVSGSGTLVYSAGGIFPDPQHRHFWLDRSGRSEPFALPDQKPLTAARFSPDGRRIAWYSAGEAKGIWVQDLRRNTLVPIVSGGYSSFPHWTPNGGRVLFNWSKAGPTNIWSNPSDGSEDLRRLTTSALHQTSSSMTADSKYVAVVESRPGTGYDIVVVQLPDGKVSPFANSPSNEGWPEFSPDGRWLAYASNDTGRYEVYAKPFPGSGARVPVSNQGGIAPLWGPSGRELFYWDPGYTQLLKVDVTTGRELAVSLPKLLFQFPAAWSTPIRSYDISPDGKRFLIRERTKYTPAEVTQLQVVLNWFEELKRLCPTGKN